VSPVRGQASSKAFKAGSERSGRRGEKKKKKRQQRNPALERPEKNRKSKKKKRSRGKPLAAVDIREVKKVDAQGKNCPRPVGEEKVKT